MTTTLVPSVDIHLIQEPQTQCGITVSMPYINFGINLLTQTGLPKHITCSNQLSIFTWRHQKNSLNCSRYVYIIVSNELTDQSTLEKRTSLNFFLLLYNLNLNNKYNYIQPPSTLEIAQQTKSNTKFL